MIIILFILICLFIFFSVLLAENLYKWAKDYKMVKWTDLSEYTVEELTALHKSIGTELKKREEEDKCNCIIAMNTLMNKFAKWCDSVAFNNWRKEFNDIYARDITGE